MMRRGELAEYPPADVLRAAASERLTGGVEFDGEVAVCVYLEEGEVYLAAHTDAEVALTVDDDLDDVAYEAARRSDESRLRTATVSVVTSLLGRREGWYFFHALTDHPTQGHWGWPVEDILAEASAGPGEPPPSGSEPDQPHRAVDGRPPSWVASEDGSAPIEAETAAPDAGGPPPVTVTAGADDEAPGWHLAPTPPAGGIDPSAWTVLVAMAGTISKSEIAARLGWSVDETEAAVGHMIDGGMLVASGEGVAAEEPGEGTSLLRR